AARHAHRDSPEDGAAGIRKAHRLDVDQGFFGHAGKSATGEFDFSSFALSPFYNRRVKKARLLVVDDDPLIAESLAYALSADYEVVCAGDRAAAVERL